MKVYRIENRRGEGPYASGDWYPPSVHYSTRARPGWSRDNIYGGDTFRAGCASIEALRAWFRGCMRSLRKAGFYVVTYKVAAKHVHRGSSGKQLAFDHRYATRIGGE
jgi:hypothetical protein